MAFINGSFTDLPKGYKRGQLPDAVISNEMHGLRRDAEEQASSYEILTQVQIANLHQVWKGRAKGSRIKLTIIKRN